jgi:GMP synthase (glutamine-hydrolysing)
VSDVWVLQHLEAEPPALIESVLRRQGHALRVFRSERGELPPRLAPGCAGLVVLGGPMAVYQPERNPWMPGEQVLIRQALDADLPVLGMCLGAQLLAQAAGARVYPGERPKEIGWGRISHTASGQADPVCGTLADASGNSAATVFQWHGDTFDLPPGAVLLASSALYPHQAFRLGRAAYGFQFHFEVTEAIIRDWVQRWQAEVLREGLDPQAILAGIPHHLSALQERGEAAIQAWGELLTQHRAVAPLRSVARTH